MMTSFTADGSSLALLRASLITTLPRSWAFIEDSAPQNEPEIMEFLLILVIFYLGI